MKRNLDLIRELLIQAENKDIPTGWIVPKFDDFTKDEVTYHINLLWQADLVEAVDLSTTSGYEFGIVNLTWNGHEFLDATRDNKLWAKTKKFLGNKVSSATFEIIKQVSISLIKQEIGI